MRAFIILLFLTTYQLDIALACGNRVYRCLDANNKATTEFCGGSCRHWLSCGLCHDRSKYVEFCKATRPASTNCARTDISCEDPNWIPRW
jgi:hypothetical protein